MAMLGLFYFASDDRTEFTQQISQSARIIIPSVAALVETMKFNCGQKKIVLLFFMDIIELSERRWRRTRAPPPLLWKENLYDS